MKVRWKSKPCGCVNTRSPGIGKMTIRCSRHRGKPSKKGRLLCYFDEAGIVRLET